MLTFKRTDDNLPYGAGTIFDRILKHVLYVRSAYNLWSFQLYSESMFYD